ncbi:type II toxin-antitoxin system Phd/YefM family antitoxin [Tsukamurella asaccharolytica]|uniref:type II toxin-antitoxin system Phd/YefM family antitoxin n=1 Tax=Tsukamurella asaccharolytica TaxID=2592067 RepID=UPI0013150724|nr:type II toxin-antitoxin system Phd/YefM family antitoxin [Tsukamurella asaccharolytica]
MTERSEVPQATSPTVPLHRARAALSALIAACEREPITLTRNGHAVAVLVHPSVVAVEDEPMLTPSARPGRARRGVNESMGDRPRPRYALVESQRSNGTTSTSAGDRAARQ